MSEVIRKTKNVVLVRFVTAAGNEYVVTSHHPKWGIQSQKFFDQYSALQFFTLTARTLAYGEAKEAGLDDHTADRVALGQMSLAEALGDMDVTEESEYMADYEDYLANQGGEDDNTPPLEVLMAGGWSSWEYQNEKNAWLDSRY